jgi:hypothetical protein
MVFLVRKVEKAKWLQKPITDGAEVSADAITNCLKTKSNTISVWEISEEKHINDAILALASGADHIDTIDVVLLPRRSVIDAGLFLESIPGITPAQDLINSHRNISDLDYTSLGVLKNIIVDEFKKDRVIRYTRKQLITLIRNAITTGRLIRTSLKPDVLKVV